jgi:hypothetical protein
MISLWILEQKMIGANPVDKSAYSFLCLASIHP